MPTTLIGNVLHTMKRDLPFTRSISTIVAVAFSASLLFACHSASAADRLRLPNGETLLGSLVAEDAEGYLFRSDSFGELRVPKASAAVLERDVNASASPEERQPGWVAAAPAPLPPPPAKAAAPAPKKAEKSKWERNLEAGYSFQARGDDLQGQTAYLRTDITRRDGDNSLQFYGKYLFGEQNDVNSANKLEAGVKLRQGFTRYVQIRNDFSYSYDRLKELSNQFEDIFGLNFRLINTERLMFRIGPGIAVQYAEPKLGENGWELLGDVSQEFTWKLSDGVDFSQSASYLYDPRDLSDYRFRFFSVLKCRLMGNASVNLRYEYEFEALRAIAQGRSDHRVFTTLGYRF